MAKKKLPRPTPGELDVLAVLWTLGPSSVRTIYAESGAGRGVRYTTLLKQVQVMHEKGLVRRDESARAHLYEAALERLDFMRDVLARYYGGSTRNLLADALAARAHSRDEIETIVAVAKKHRKEAKKG